MRHITNFSVVALLLLSITSCNLIKKDSKNSATISQIVEAEDMILTNYKINEVGETKSIQLTEPTGTAKFTFTLPTGNYDIEVRYLSESVGQNTYALYVNNYQIVAWLGKNKDDQWHMLSEQHWHVPRHVAINNGDEIRIEALSNNGSLVTLDYVKFTTSTRISKTVDEVSNNDSATQQTKNYNTTSDEWITIHPKEYEKAIKNPLKGFRPYNQTHEYGTLMKIYFKWNELENAATDDVKKIKEFCQERWRGVEKNNIKVIARVYLEWPGQDTAWPADMTVGDYSSDQFKERVVSLIKKLGEAWDNEPCIAFIEMGLIGQWGEQEYPNTRDDIKEAVAAQFNESFKNKLVMIRWPNSYNDHLYNFGYYWDSFAHLDQEYCGVNIDKTSPKWKTAVIGGEPAFDWGNSKIQPGINPNVALKESVHRDYIIDRIRKLHANHLGWIAAYDQNNDTVRAGAAIMQKAFGYRFVIPEFSYHKTINADSNFMVSFKVMNTGSGPLYYNWPVEISLLNPKTKKVVWKEQCKDVDVRKWLPGDKWNDSTKTYEIPAETYTVNQAFKVSNIPAGEYILAIAVLDPAGNLPCLRFAMENYYNGGRHPIGKVGVNRKIDSFEISRFDDIQSDNSLHYEIAKK